MAPAPTNKGAAASVETPQESSAAKPAATSGRLAPWLPLLANLVLMPVLAYGTVTFLIIPKMSAARTGDKKAGVSSSEAAKEGKQKVSVPLGAKVLVNVAGTMGTRYLLANITLVGSNPLLKQSAEKNDAELRDAAASALSVKTINDLEKPGARNLIRAELISVFNNILGQGTVTDIYLTEFAIQ